MGQDVVRRRRCGPKGRELPVLDHLPLHASCSLTLLTSCRFVSFPFLVELRDGTNNRFDFANFVIAAVEQGYIGRGDLLIVDNATIHTANDVLPSLVTLLDALSAHFVCLPTYSPEFNPCELVFSEMKTFMRNHFLPGQPLDVRINQAIQSISFDHVVSFYRHCAGEGARMAAMN